MKPKVVEVRKITAGNLSRYRVEFDRVVTCPVSRFMFGHIVVVADDELDAYNLGMQFIEVRHDERTKAQRQADRDKAKQDKTG